jgi:uncharacterized protein (TIGR02246 family)
MSGFRALMMMILMLVAVRPDAALAREHAPLKASGPTNVKEALIQWQQAVESGDAKAIVGLYGKDAVLISAFAQLPITTREGLLAYYKKVVANPGIKVTVTEQHPRMFGNVALNSGQYVLSYEQEGEPIEIGSRFSFVYEWRGNKWVIVDHHSSAVPVGQNIEKK